MRTVRGLSAALGLLLAPLLLAAAPVRLAYVFSDGNIPGTLRAYDQLLREQPQLQGQVQLALLTESTATTVDAIGLESADVLVYDVMNEQLLGQFNAAHKFDLLQRVKSRRGVVLGVGEGLRDATAYAKEGVEWDARARAYWTHSGAQNQLALMKLALGRAGVKGLTLPEPQLSLDFGYYYPDAGGGRVFADWAAFDAWRAAQGKRRPGAPRVAIGFFKASFYSGDMALLDALVASIEKQGGEAVPLFGYPGIVSLERLLRAPDGSPRADVVLGSNFNFSDATTASRVAQLGMPVLNIITLYGRSAADWKSSPAGLSSFEGTFNLAVPEFAGTIAPTVVGTKEKVPHPSTGLVSIVTSPVAGQVDLAVSRALRIARLRALPNASKKIALLYYNFPPGKAAIGASYLNVAESIANIVAAMARAGYDVGGAPPDAARVLKDITAARNVGGNAPGELKEMLAGGTAVRIPVSQYRKWLANYAAPLRAKIVKDWGDPAQAAFMLDAGGAEPSLIVPVVRYGRLTLLPQPARAWGEDLEKLYHAKDLAPHHQYIAAYAWLRNGLKADAVVHLGTHGTLEWLDGKDVGLSPEDAPDALIADLPNAYIYNVDVVGEGLVARRRGQAMLVDHMVPSFRKGGLGPQLSRLNELIDDHSRNESKNPELAGTFAKQAREEAVRLGIARELKLSTTGEWSDADLHRVESYLLDLRRTDIPYGLHAFGRTPPLQQQRETADAIAALDRSALPEKQRVLATDMQARIAASGPRELASLLAALSGRALPSGTGGEPLRNPDSYATGKNFYGIDPDKVPKPASWELGVKLADQMLAAHLKEHGRHPEKVSFVIWGDETMRHEGVIESQIFHLLGTRPVWDARGKVIDVQVIPRSQLGRPRVDIVIASAAEGMFSNVTRLMDEAVQKVKVMEEADNQVRRHYLATRAALIAKGRAPAEADRLAGVRIFDEPPGQYNLNTSAIVANSGSWDNDTGFANDYMRKMGHGYGNGFHGEPMEDVFRLALAGTDKVVHSSSTTLYGALDNDDMYMYMGGLASAVRSIDGKTPDLMIANTRDPSRPEMTTAEKFVGQEFRSRYVNPVWIQGMQKEGYAGAGEMRAFVEYLWGWDATATQVVDDAMWQETFDVYVEDSLKQGMKGFFEKSSPLAFQDMVARMSETVRKGYWKADAATRATLAREYIDSIERHGVSCTEVSCGNARLLEFVLEEARKAGVAPAAIAGARQALEKAMGRGIDAAASQLRDFAKSNDAREIAAAKAAGAKGAAPTVRGYVMQERQRASADAAGAGAASPVSMTLVFGALVLALLLVWRWRHARNQPGPEGVLRSAVPLLLAGLSLAGCAAPSVLSPADGRAYEVSAAWVDARPAVAWYGGRLAHEAIFLQFADSRGRPSAPPMQLTDASRDAYEPSLQDLDGDALVAWYEQEPAPRRQWAFIARFDSDGRRLWRRQISAPEASGRIPVVRVAGGVIHAAWLEQRGDAMPVLRVASLDASGQWLQAPRDAAVVGHNTWNLNAAIAADGVFHVLLDAAQGGQAKELHWVQVREDRIENSRVSRDDGRESAYPDIAFDGPRYAVTWFDSRDGNEEVYLRCGQTASSGALPADMMLDDAAALRVTRTSTQSTGAYLTWHDGRIELAWTEGSGANRVLWMQRFDHDCRPLDPARIVDGQGTEAGVPSLAASATGLLLSWNGQRGDPAAPAHGHSRRPSSVVLLRVWPKPVSPSAAAR